MKRYFFLAIVLLFCLGVHSQTGREFIVSQNSLKYSNGNMKETADWKDGLIIGYRKLYNEQGQLIELHYFGKDSTEFVDGKPVKGPGVIKTYHPNGQIAAIVPVYQSLRQVRGQNEYDLKIEYDMPIVGFYSNGKKAYEYMMERPFTINSSNNSHYKNKNCFYPDIFTIDTDLEIDGLNTAIKYFDEDGALKSQGQIKSGRKNGSWKFYYPNGKTESNGDFFFKNKNYDLKVGLWKYFDETGILIKEEEFYKGGNDKKFKYNDRINLYKEYFSDGSIKLMIQYPLISDANLYVDTIEFYHSPGVLAEKYTHTDKAKMYTGQPYNYSGRFESFYKDGKRKEIGYLSMIPREGASEAEVNFNPCIMQNNKKIGYWYFFNEAGVLLKIVQYDFCGNEKSHAEQKKVDKENSKYQGSKDKYEFDFTLKL
jgi:antitoxin component YwqK of YwqJK toxin-antitoxin module